MGRSVTTERRAKESGAEVGTLLGEMQPENGDNFLKLGSFPRLNNLRTGNKKFNYSEKYPILNSNFRPNLKGNP